MSRQNPKTLLYVLSLLIAAGAALAFVIKEPRIPKEISASKQGPSAQTTRANGARIRNLSLQPEAFSLSRRLGQRFSPAKRSQSTLSGLLTIGSDQKVVTVIRKQTDDGEQIAISVAGSLSVLTWDASQGSLSSGNRASSSDRELIERLVFDSPDQFVLAQLRGASYFTVARHVRPANAGDNYSGPLWNIVRINDPDNDENRRPQSRWRLFYLNAVTGLIDRIESEVQGQRIVAEISGWTDLNGEKVPTQIDWKREGRTLMRYILTNFTRAEG